MWHRNILTDETGPFTSNWEQGTQAWKLTCIMSEAVSLRWAAAEQTSQTLNCEYVLQHCQVNDAERLNITRSNHTRNRQNKVGVDMTHHKKTIRKYHKQGPGLECLFVGWLLNIPATCQCISGTDLLRQFYVLPHWYRSCRSNFLPYPVTVHWHRADQS